MPLDSCISALQHPLPLALASVIRQASQYRAVCISQTLQTKACRPTTAVFNLVAAFLLRLIQLLPNSRRYVPDLNQTAIHQMASAGHKISPQQQGKQPGEEAAMHPTPEYIRQSYRGSNKLEGKVAIISGGDSGIGRAVAVHFAREGADVCVMYKDEHQDAQDTQKLVEAEGRRCIVFPGDIGDCVTSKEAVQRTVQELGRIDIVVSNAAVQHYKENVGDISQQQLEDTFRTNVFGMFYLVQAALPHLKAGACIINSTSVVAYKGAHMLVDYAATKGAITSFTRSLSQQLLPKGIRVNAVAPGPIWTPLIPATFPKDTQETWDKSVPMGRAGQPSECGPAYVFLASEDASYFAGQVLHPNGGVVVNG